jgi:hypothetical protein
VVDETKGKWRKAKEVPGTAILNKGGGAGVASLSCSSAGSCSAGGSYLDASNKSQVFVVDETKGKWGKAKEVPGTATLNRGGGAGVASLSCASSGSCSAGGTYLDASGHSQAFVVDETKGKWRNAEEVPATATLNKNGVAAWTPPPAGVASLSCASAGSCSAGGSYVDASGYSQAFVVDETKGKWGKAKEVPGTATLNKGDGSFNGGNDNGVASLACSSPGSCSAGGSYVDASGNTQAFVVDETKGKWGNAKEVPGTAILNKGGGADNGVDSLSCTSPGDCSAGGSYSPEVYNSLSGFVVNETNGKWGQAAEVPGIAALSSGGEATVLSLSCGSAGSCIAGGYYYGDSPSYPPASEMRAFVVDETKGKWGKAIEVPGTDHPL